MTATKLSALPFVDIVLGQDFCDLKAEEPTVTRMVCALKDYGEEVIQLRKLCEEKECNTGAEFTLVYGSLRFRVTTMKQESGTVWFLSRIDAKVRPLSELPLPRNFVAFAMRPKLQGLLLITGGFGAGKTTAASSLFRHRIATLGGTGVALEDPTGEVQMEGRHGEGRIIQIPVSQKNGGYHPALQLVRRSRADFIMVGEIRDALTAVEAQDIANTDVPVIATMHASSIEETFDKYQAYMRSQHASSSEANARLAMSIAGIVHITKEYVQGTDKTFVPRYVPRCLVLDRNDQNCFGALGKIREGNFIDLHDDVTFQATRHYYAP